MVGCNGMRHPAYCDFFCKKHEHWHKSDICPLCEAEDEEAQS